MAAHQTPPSLGFSRQEHWSGLPFPSPMHGSEKWKGSCPVVSNFLATPWTTAYQAPPSMGFSRQEYWSGVPFSSLKVSLEIEIFHKLDIILSARSAHGSTTYPSSQLTADPGRHCLFQEASQRTEYVRTNFVCASEASGPQTVISKVPSIQEAPKSSINISTNPLCHRTHFMMIGMSAFYSDRTV